MLILRATYAPELHSGMTQNQVAAYLPAILSRLNPRGNGLPSQTITATPRSWNEAVQTALGPGADPAARRNAAATAARTAQQQGWQDHRRAFSHYMLGRMTQVNDPELAQQYYSTALHYLKSQPRY